VATAWTSQTYGAQLNDRRKQTERAAILTIMMSVKETTGRDQGGR
jgi:hypothetical protein